MNPPGSPSLTGPAAGLEEPRPSQATPSLLNAGKLGAKPAPAGEEAPRFFGELESLRGIAALGVVVGHLGWSNLPLRGPWTNSYLLVDLFFVLSGFVICHSYSTKIPDLRGLGRFLFLRLGRLYPLHFCMLLVALGIELAKYLAERHYGLQPHASHAFSTNNGGSFLTNLFLLQALGFHRRTTFNGPSWSISVEFYTYVVFGLLVLCFPDRKRLALAMGLLLGGALLVLSRFGGVGLTDVVGTSFFRCLVGFSLGVLIYQLHRASPTWLDRSTPLLQYPLSVFLLVFLSVKREGNSDFLVLPAFALLILAVTTGPRTVFTRGLNSPPLRWLGKVSYSIYMTHQAVLILMGAVLPRLLRACFGGPSENAAGLAAWQDLVFVALSLGTLLVISHFTYQWIEAPGQRKAQFLARQWFGAGRGSGSGA